VGLWSLLVLLKRRTVCALFTFMLLSGIICSFGVEGARADDTIYIKADGSIIPTDSPISTTDNFTYTLTSNISGSYGIVIERDNIVVDGAGYTFRGINAEESRGMDVTGRSNVTIRNTNIKNYTHGIYLGYYSSYNNILRNNITNNWEGIRLISSSVNSISGNKVTASNWDGIRLDSSSSNSISGNNIETAFSVDGVCLCYSSGNDISGNTITASTRDGIYLYSSSNNSISGNNITNNWGGICLYSSSDNSVSGNKIANSDVDIWVYLSSGNSVYGNNIVNSSAEGIGLVSSSVNNISGNNIIANNEQGIVISSLSSSSLNNKISGNNITANKQRGIYLESTFGNTISGNNVANNGMMTGNYSGYSPGSGIDLRSSSNNNIAENSIDNNYEYGIHLNISPNNSVVRNNITNNWFGIEFDSCSNSNIAENTLVENSIDGIKLYDSSSNSISRNNLASNEGGILLDSSNENSVFGNKIETSVQGLGLIQSQNNTFSKNTIVNAHYILDLEQACYNTFYQNNFESWILFRTFGIQRINGINFWDNGLEGNYWNDYTGTDSNQDGISDTPFHLDENNTDRYPLMGTFQSFNVSAWNISSDLFEEVDVISNSTIDQVQLVGYFLTDVQYPWRLDLVVHGQNGTIGFCRVTFPNDMLNSSTYPVYIIGNFSTTQSRIVESNGTRTTLYFTYNQPSSNYNIDILPEFPSFLVIPLFMVAMLLAIVIHKRRHMTRAL
jgi:parallel beta-helix repeat protein